MELLHQHSSLVTQLALIASAILILSILCTYLAVSFAFKHDILTVKKSFKCGEELARGPCCLNFITAVSKSRYKTGYLFECLQIASEKRYMVSAEQLRELTQITSEIHEDLAKLEKSL